MCYVQDCVIAVQCNISSTRRYTLIMNGINTHLSHEIIQYVRYVFTVFYIQGIDIPTLNYNVTIIF